MITAVLSSPLAFIKLMNQGPMELFIHGGPIMWPILITSFIGITVAVERIIFLVREALSREPEVVEKMYDRVEAGDPEGAIALGKKSKDVIAKILTYALSHRSQLNNAFVRAANNELKRYQQGGAVLDTVITAAPLLGLLGTVTGMMETFGALGTGDIGAAAGKITGGVAEALIATMCGLGIAIFGLVPYNILNAKIEQTKHDISDASNALAIVGKKVTEKTAA